MSSSLVSIAPPPALVIVGAAETPAAGEAHSLPLDAVLLAALPAARRVLAIDCGPGTLGRQYQQCHPAVQWLDVGHASLDHRLTGRFDLIVLGNGLPSIADPLALLRALARLADEGAHLVLQTANHTRLAAIERLIEADFADDAGEPAAVSTRRSPAGTYRLLMDAGWMPTLAGQRAVGAVNGRSAAAALAMADALAIPRNTAQRMLALDQLIIRAHRPFDSAVEDAADAPAPGRAPFTVIVPTTREHQLRLNVERSPGLREVGARIVSYRKASGPAEALQESLPHCGDETQSDWVLLCHQDVYFPAGFGHRLSQVLNAVPAAEREGSLFGFIGMGVDAATQGYAPAGFVIDRLECADHPASDAAVSIDELAVVLPRRSVHRIDPQFGWHLWATDLCLAAICEHKRFARILRLPLFHNSVTDFALPRAFFDSAALLRAKYPSLGPIATLCGTLDDAFMASAPPAL